jgi:RHS repeat-associated protein
VETESTITRFAYDPLGRRMRKDSSPKVVRPFDAGSRYQKTEAERRSKAEHLGTTFYGWDGDRLAWESTEESCVHYLYEPGSFAPIAQARSDKPIQLHRTPDWSGKAYKFSEDPLWQQSPQPHPFTQIVFYHCDQIGTPQEMTDEEGEIAWQAQYKAWGEAKVVVEKIRNPLRFQGQYFDHETGLHYNRFRYYDPEIGRYLSKDPIGFAGGLNLHAYVANPTQWVDPLGLWDRFPFANDPGVQNAALQAQAQAQAQAEINLRRERTKICPSKPPRNNSDWRLYPSESGRETFHCGYEGYLARVPPTPENPMNECFYDENDNLVDDNHPYAGCQGTPDQYDGHGSLLDKIMHTGPDSGGIWNKGWEAYKESNRHKQDKANGVLKTK